MKSDNKAAARARPISSYLIGLALATSLPIAAATAFLAYDLVWESSQHIRSGYEDRLRLMRKATELRVANMIEHLQILALSPALQQGDFADFKAHASEVANLIGAISIVVYAQDGQQLLNTRLGPNDPLPVRREFEVERRVFETGLPQVSNLLITLIDGKPFVTIATPVRISGEIRYALAAGLSTTYLSGLMDQYVSDELVGSIVDGNGIVLAQRPLMEDAGLIAEPASEEVREHIGKSAAFWIKTTSRTGIPTYTSFLKCDQIGWTINLSVPREVIDGPLHRTVEGIAALAFVTLVLSFTFARLFGKRFLAALAGFEEYVVELGRSRVAQPSAGPITEINRMKNVLHGVGKEIAAAHQLVERERSLLRATVESLPIGVLLAAPSGEVKLVNDRMLSIWGIEDLETINDADKLSGSRESGDPYRSDDWPIVRALREGLVTEAEEVVRFVHGARRNVMMTAVPVYDDNGGMIAAVCACYDVTDLRNALRQQKALLAEINHRVKNTLATVQSIARLSRASSHNLDQYVAAFQERLLALSAAYNLLTENNWEGASLEAIIQRTLAPFAGRDRLDISGQALVLPPKAALAISAAIQELSTNAAKYGALSSAAGKVRVSWSAQPGGLTRLLWVESDGPAVGKPSRQGFGTSMIRGIFRNEPRWEVTLDFDARGLRCTMYFSTKSHDSEKEPMSMVAAS